MTIFWMSTIFFSVHVNRWHLHVFVVILLYLQSDPMAVIYTKKSDGMLEELGRTEVLLNSLNPTWITKFTVTFYFELVQSLV